MREKLSHRSKRYSVRRITPAYAGKTKRLQQTTKLIQDHPRVCGKNRQMRAQRKRSLGSPPRMREKLYYIQKMMYTLRITPAYAGKTRKIKSTNWYFRDHPRVCGKNRGKDAKGDYIKGSPPRMREKHTVCPWFFTTFRITPAYAGKTTCKHVHAFIEEDHPRVCGKNTQVVPALVFA